MWEEILPGLYKLEIPLPNNPLKALNSYVLKGRERNLIIDTGMNREECKSVILSGLKELEVNLRQTDFFITHMHADHSGLVSELCTETSTIYCSEADARIINHGVRWDDMLDFARLSGFPENKLQEAYKKHPGYKYSSRGYLNFRVIKEGDIITIGNYLFKCIETPGHTPGHMCLYEPQKKILVAGDHILSDITPNISLWSDEGDPLDEYLKSLDKIHKFDVRLVLPGHRKLFKDCKKRIQELKLHHRKRTEEVLSILKKGSQDAFQVASQMSWDLTYASWDLFPVPQKWFATGEAIAHLKYLEGKGKVKRQEEEGKMVYTLN